MKWNNRGFSMIEMAVSTILIALIAVALVGVMSVMKNVNQDADQFNRDTLAMAEAVSGQGLTDSGREIEIIVTDKNSGTAAIESFTLKEYVVGSDSGDLKYYIVPGTQSESE